MEESDLILAELQRIRLLLSRLVVFLAVFSLLVVFPALAWLSWCGYTLTYMSAETFNSVSRVFR